MVPQWTGLPLAVLTAISNASGESYALIEGAEFLAELRRLGHDPDPVHLLNLMDEMRGSRYIDFSASPGNEIEEAVSGLRLQERGRQQVEGWPRSSEATEADFQALLAVLEDRAEDTEQPEAERDNYRAALGGLSRLTNAVGVSVVTAWVNRRIGLS